MSNERTAAIMGQLSTLVQELVADHIDRIRDVSETATKPNGPQKAKGGRPRIGKDPTVVEKFRLPGDIAERFEARLKQLDKKKADVLRSLVERWLRETDKIARQRAGSSK